MKECICKEEIGGGIYIHTIYEPVQKLVRCKDCKYRNQHGECKNGYGYHSDSWFCADGAKRNDLQ